MSRPTSPQVSEKVRIRYPWKARLVVGAASALAIVSLMLGSLFIMPMIPLIPTFVVLIIANGSLMSSALGYAESVAQVVPETSPSHRKLSKLAGPHAQGQAAPLSS
jgi:hypothetical protein